jgi:hypothetical protein
MGTSQDRQGHLSIVQGYRPTFAKHPAAPTKWTYRAIFRLDDQRVGQWSDDLSINVG